METTVYGTIYFMDKTKLTLRWPRQGGNDPIEIASTIKKALESDRIMAEGGDQEVQFRLAGDGDQVRPLRLRDCLLLVPGGRALVVLRELLERGKPLGLVPVGFAAMELARVEAGIPRFGIDMDEGTSLERTEAATNALARYLVRVPEATDVTTYVGTSSPADFNGLIRHYYMRGGANVADIRLNLLSRKARSQQSHAIGLRMRLM